MEKYLFNDGTNVIREVESESELQVLINSAADPNKARIWMFNTSEWITVSAYNKSRIKPSPKEKKLVPAEVEIIKAPRNSSHRLLIKKGLIFLLGCVVIFLIYNFTRVTWSKASAIVVLPERPANSPVMNIDSLIETIEWSRGQKLDKVTRTNLRIRNTWPDRIQLKLSSDRDTSSSGGTKYYNLSMSLDNSTGYQVDEAVSEFQVWSKGNKVHSDTLVFSNVGYAYPSERKLEGEFKGDSLSVMFLTIRSRSFNFCYSSEKESNYGNFNDRWFCR
jgi:hypothetical protein